MPAVCSLICECTIKMLADKFQKYELKPVIPGFRSISLLGANMMLRCYVCHKIGSQKCKLSVADRHRNISKTETVALGQIIMTIGLH